MIMNNETPKQAIESIRHAENIYNNTANSLNALLAGEISSYHHIMTALSIHTATLIEAFLKKEEHEEFIDHFCEMTKMILKDGNIK